jgi:spore cortex biosynthesis protein YabQ
LTGLFAQIHNFVLTLLLGVIAGLIFHFYQLLIGYARINKYLLYVCDFIVWIIMLVLVLIGMLLINQGEMRVYVLIALIIGALVYFQMLANKLKEPLARVAQALLWLSGSIVRAIKRPLARLVVFIKSKLAKPVIPPPEDIDG